MNSVSLLYAFLFRAVEISYLLWINYGKSIKKLLNIRKITWLPAYRYIKFILFVYFSKICFVYVQTGIYLVFYSPSTSSLWNNRVTFKSNLKNWGFAHLNIRNLLWVYFQSIQISEKLTDKNKSELLGERERAEPSVKRPGP